MASSLFRWRGTCAAILGSFGCARYDDGPRSVAVVIDPAEAARRAAHAPFNAALRVKGKSVMASRESIDEMHVRVQWPGSPAHLELWLTRNSDGPPTARAQAEASNPFYGVHGTLTLSEDPFGAITHPPVLVHYDVSGDCSGSEVTWDDSFVLPEEVLVEPGASKR